MCPPLFLLYLLFKNYCGSFDKNIDENITKARKKAGILFSADFDRRKMNPMVYIKFWRQACIPALLFGAELWTVTKSGLEKLERCQRWFLKKLFHLPDFVDSLLLNIISGLPTVGSLLHQKKLYFLGRILTLPEVPKVVLDILKLRLNMLNVDSDSNSIGFLSEILYSLETYNLMPYLHLWQRVSIFPSYRKWKHIVNSRIFSHERADIFTASEAKPVVKLTLAAFTNYPPENFWSLTWNNPDLVPNIRTQIRLLVNAGLKGSVPWLQGTNDVICPLCKVEPEDNFHFMLRCNIMKPEWNKFWEKLLSIVEVNCRQECDVLAQFLRNLDNYSRVLLLSGGLELPFLKHTCDTVRRFISVSVHKLYKIRDRLVTRGTIRAGESSVCFSALARWSMDDSMSIHHILT